MTTMTRYVLELIPPNDIKIGDTILIKHKDKLICMHKVTEIHIKFTKDKEPKTYIFFGDSNKKSLKSKLKVKKDENILKVVNEFKVI